MGLDMYLNAKRYLWTHGDHPDQQIAGAINALLPEIKPGKRFGDETCRIKEIVAEAIYWRKANAIHDWFVKNVQGGEDNCGNYYVSREQLQALRDLCLEVIADRNKASELLPTASGFFFGPTDYDQYYFDDLQRTADEINDVLALPDGWDFEYHSSW